MAWVPLTKPMTWNAAQKVAEGLELSCVSWWSKSRRGSGRKYNPIVMRTFNNGRLYIYYEDGTCERTRMDYFKKDEQGNAIVERYVPCTYVPDNGRYSDLLSFFRDKLKFALDTYKTVLVYNSDEKWNLTYSLYYGVFQTSIELPFSHTIMSYVDYLVYDLDWEAGRELYGV